MRGCFALLCLILAARLAAADRPNVLVLVADDLRPDGIAALGNPVARTPHLDALAARSLVFTRAFCSYPICVVSRTEMMTGRHHWEYRRNGGPFREGQTTWPEAFRDAGYETWHTGKWHVSGRPSQRGYTDVAGLFTGGGADFWKEGRTDRRGVPVTGYVGWIFQSEDGKELHPELGVGLTPETNDRIADAALSLIRRGAETPWFCHVNFTAPHDPLFPSEASAARLRDAEIGTPPDFLPEHPFDHGNLKGRDELLLPFPRTEASVRELRRDYHAVIEDLDRAVGKILAGLAESGEGKNTVVIFTSDHGLAAGSHGLSGKQNQYDHTLRVPLLIAGPGIPPGRTAAMVYLRELFPTTCDLAGIPIPASVTGRSFDEVLKGESEGHHDAVFGTFTDTQRSIQTADGWKLVFYPKVGKFQLFDLNGDPDEMHNLAADGIEHPRFKELFDKLMEWQAKMDPEAIRF
jgi:arylsulfatase A-like enzyme